MDVETKLRVHLETIVAPKGVPISRQRMDELCDAATLEHRQGSYRRAYSHGPLLLASEYPLAKKWVINPVIYRAQVKFDEFMDFGLSAEDLLKRKVASVEFMANYAYMDTLLKVKTSPKNEKKSAL